MRPALPPLLQQHLATIGDLCREFGVSSLEVFGSAADGRFDAACSDVDFIARFLDAAPGVDLG